MNKKRIALLIVAYNAASTITKVLDRIPADTKEMVEEIFVFDNHSPDNTNLVVEEWKRENGFEKLSIFRNHANLGYGGNQKRGYDYAIKRGYDIVVMLHGDGQYAPEALPEIISPLLEDRVEAVFGSRMLVKGAARKGGMPLYKFIGNKILTFFENVMTGGHLSEWHSGYRAYSVKALSQIPLKEDTDDYHFDSEIIIQFLDHGFRIVEVPVPTYYGDEICYVNGMKYAALIFKTVCQYRLHKLGIKKYAKFEKNVSAAF
ncbi:MAG: glycosyltransferase family 2 protein [Patescibacteria group bacterium]|nr:glycosyltransferase family 2 protein [Patescibacteria group bacterium]